MSTSSHEHNPDPPSSPQREQQQQQQQPQQQQQGIDIRQAMEILSARSSEPHSHPENNNNSASGDEDTEGGCHCARVPDEACRGMGQIIDMYEGLDDLDGGGDEEQQAAAAQKAAAAATKTVEEKKAALDAERATRLAAIGEQLEAMTVPQLLNAVLEAQQQRVAAYRAYDAGLETLLKTKNVTGYPQVCAEATAAFSVLSDTINAIQKMLADPHNRPDLKELVATLQTHEKEKLNLTAALHLERIRADSGGTDGEGTAGAGEAADERIAMLLREGVKSLQGKVSVCVESINDDIEEIRCAMMDE